MFLLGACPLDPGPVAELLNIIIPDTYSKPGIENKSLSTKNIQRIQLGSLLNKPHWHSTFKFEWILQLVKRWIGPPWSNHVHTGPSIGAAPTGEMKHKTPRPSKFDNRTCLEAPRFSKPIFQVERVVVVRQNGALGSWSGKVGICQNEIEGFWWILKLTHHPRITRFLFCHSAYSPPLIHHPSTRDGLSTQRPWKDLKLGRWNAPNDQLPWRPGDTFAPEIWLGSAENWQRNRTVRFQSWKSLQSNILILNSSAFLNQYCRINIAYKLWTP